MMKSGWVGIVLLGMIVAGAGEAAARELTIHTDGPLVVKAGSQDRVTVWISITDDQGNLVTSDQLRGYEGVNKAILLDEIDVPGYHADSEVRQCDVDQSKINLNFGFSDKLGSGFRANTYDVTLTVGNQGLAGCKSSWQEGNNVWRIIVDAPGIGRGETFLRVEARPYGVGNSRSAIIRPRRP